MSRDSPNTSLDSLSSDVFDMPTSMSEHSVVTNATFSGSSSVDFTLTATSLSGNALVDHRPESGLSDITTDDNFAFHTKNFNASNGTGFNIQRRKMLGERDRVSDSILDYGGGLNSIDMDGLGFGLGNQNNNNHMRFGRSNMFTNDTMTDIESVGSSSSTTRATLLSDMQLRLEREQQQNQNHQPTSPPVSDMQGLLGNTAGNVPQRRLHSGSFDGAMQRQQQQQHQQHHHFQHKQQFQQQHHQSTVQQQQYHQQHQQYGYGVHANQRTNHCNPQPRNNQTQLDLTSFDDDTLRDLVCNIALRVLQEAANNSRNIHKSARNIADILNSYEIPSTGAVLKAVELANALRTKIGTPVLAHIRGRFGGLLNLLEQSETFCVIRIPRNDFVTLTSTAKVLNDFAQARSNAMGNNQQQQQQHQHQHQPVQSPPAHFNNYDYTSYSNGKGQVISDSNNASSTALGNHMDAPPGFYQQQTVTTNQSVFDMFGEGRIEDIKLDV